MCDPQRSWAGFLGTSIPSHPSPSVGLSRVLPCWLICPGYHSTLTPFAVS